jgi:hypothetical protein
VVDRHQSAVRFHELGKDLLRDVLDISRIGHAAADELAQARLLALDDAGDLLV